MIRLADPRADRARPESIAMIAVAAWGVGFVLMLGVARLMPRYNAVEPRAASVARGGLPIDGPATTRQVSATRGMPTPEPHLVKPAAQPTPISAAAPASATAPAPVPGPDSPSTLTAPDRESIEASKPVDPPRAAAPVAAAPTPPQPSAAAPQPTAPAPDPPIAKKRAPASKRVFSKGVLAYLRCEGSERPHARFPCPRDEKFEESVWRTLAALPMCDTDPGSGTAEVRFLLRTSQVADVEWKAGTSGQSLNMRAIGKCAGAKLADLRTRLRAPEGLVSFRFSLE